MNHSGDSFATTDYFSENELKRSCRQLGHRRFRKSHENMPTANITARSKTRKSSPPRLHGLPFPMRRNHARRPKLLGFILITASLCCFLLLGQAGLHYRSSWLLLQDAQHHAIVRTTLLTLLMMNAKSKPVAVEGEKSIPSRVLSPFDSHPPKAVFLDTEHNPRHACLAQIRARQEKILGGFLKSSSSESVLLVDPAYHSNVGDHMITVAELQFLDHQHYLQQRNHIQNNNEHQDHIPQQHQCSYVQAGDFVPPCELAIPRRAAAIKDSTATTSIAIWHGGGNWGDLWRRAQEPRIASFETLLQFNFTQIVTMPNSWYYRNNALEAQDVQVIRERVIAGLVKRENGSTTDDIDDARLQELAPLVLTWREQSSYERARHQLPWAVNLLVPDIAFQLGPYDAAAIRSDAALAQREQHELVDLLFLLRDDHESLYATQRNRRSMRDVLQSVPGASQFTFSIVDWKDRLDRFLDNKNKNDDIFFTDTAIQLLALGRIVVCDRLHAAILAYLAGLPFIYLDQVSGKISKTLSVAMDSGEVCLEDAQWAVATGLKDAVRQAVAFMNRYELRPAVTTPENRRQQRREEREKMLLRQYQRQQKTG